MWCEVSAVSPWVYHEAIITGSPLNMSLLPSLPAPQLSLWLLNGQDFSGAGVTRRVGKRWALIRRLLAGRHPSSPKANT